ncbi:hypothetical protein ACLQ24_10020 [Micromonospora sp. DT4]|uniref:hypothetical protein n=1 Tax=Micromonospora sp. DT4 TaxID=3393438 RepID=UPI003CF32124
MKPTAGTRLEGLGLVLILIAVGGSAGAASFTHVHDWTMNNSPANTPGWFGWANAVISELVPIAALLTIRRRRRTEAPIGYPMVLLIAAAGLSLAAQLAVAKPGPSGWLLSAVPALAFMALVKLVLAPAKAGTTAAAPAAAPVEPIRVQVAEQVTTEPPAAITHAPAFTPEPVTAPAFEPVDVPAHLLPTARFAAVQHEQATGQPITPDELADRLDITPAIAGQLLTTIAGGVR